MKRARVMAVLTAGLVAVGCAEVEYRYIATESVKNGDGHVIGHKDLLRDAKTGEPVEQVTHYIPVLNEKGDIVAYEELVRGGSVIRALDGRRIGARYTDLRSRGTNPGNEGVTVTIQR